MATTREGVRSLIGVVDGSIDDRTNVSWDVNKIGGSPDWMRSNVSHPVCNACQSSLTLVAQLYCPLDGSPYHRTIYVFTCLTKSCRQNTVSFRVFRSQSIAESSSRTPQQQEPTPREYQKLAPDSATFDTDWCDDADDWGEGAEDWGHGGKEDEGSSDFMTRPGGLHPESCTETMVSYSSDTVLTDGAVNQTGTLAAIPQDNGLEQGLGKLSLHEHTRPPATETMTSTLVSMATHPQPPPRRNEPDAPQFAPYFVSVFEEPSSSVDGALSHELQLMKEYQQREGVCLAEWQEYSKGEGGARGTSAAGSEGYEKTAARHGDRAFQKFAKRIQPCPQQCIRYSYDGAPLWLTSPAPVDADGSGGVLPGCRHCGGRRQYEFQLMPALLPYLRLQEEAEERNALPIEFGVVAVYTCAQSCWGIGAADSYREELAVVQQDPDSAAVNQAQQKLSQFPQTR